MVASIEADFSKDNTEDFWSYLDRLVAGCQVTIDRPRGSRHPRYPDMVYPYDYGYLEGTQSMDGGGIDVWVGPDRQRPLNALIVTVDLNKRDVEIKLLLGCSENDQDIILHFLNEFSMRATLVRRWQDTSGLLMGRRSVRRFSPRSVPRPVIEQLISAAMQAPSAHNRQPWRFVVLSNRETRARMVEAMGADFYRDLTGGGVAPDEARIQVSRSRQRIQQVPEVVLLCLDTSVGDVYPDPIRQQLEHWMGVQGVAMAGENLLLAAHAAGLGGVWMCAPLFAQETVKQTLSLPESWQPQGLVLLGYPARIPEARPRRSLQEVTWFL